MISWHKYQQLFTGLIKIVTTSKQECLNAWSIVGRCTRFDEKVSRILAYLSGRILVGRDRRIIERFCYPENWIENEIGGG